MLRQEQIDYEINLQDVTAPLSGSLWLSQCPFCWEKFDLNIQNTWTPSVWIECGNCEGRARSQNFPHKAKKYKLSHYKLALISARDAWNRRP